jgi:hypothetical protein
VSTGRTLPTGVGAPILLEGLQVIGRVRPVHLIHRSQALLPSGTTNGELWTASRTRTVDPELSLGGVLGAPAPRSPLSPEVPAARPRIGVEAGAPDHAARAVRAARPIEVVVVVVRDHDRLERGQRGQGYRRRVKPARSEKVRRRSAGAPHRIGEHPGSVDLQRHRRMAYQVTASGAAAAGALAVAIGTCPAGCPAGPRASRARST